MMDAISLFYTRQLPDARIVNHMIQSPCPLCGQHGKKTTGTISVFLNKESFFHGYFMCDNRCCSGGFPLYFARLKGLPPGQVPGYDPDREYAGKDVDFPVKNINSQITDFNDKLSKDIRRYFHNYGISDPVLDEMRIGYNGRYLTFPYFQPDHNCYSARCTHPDKPEDSFWHGNEHFTTGQFCLFNALDIERCENGSLILVEGEINMLTLKQLGLPAVAVPTASDLEHLDPQLFAWQHTLFLWVNNSADSAAAARLFATRTGYKVRLVRWQESSPRNYSLKTMAVDTGNQFRQTVFSMLREARAFSPFASPQKEFIVFEERLHQAERENRDDGITGFPLLEKALGGFRGINIMGGTPKAGKSCFFMQMASELAMNRTPVIYYDFENGKQQIYLRTLSRLSRIPVAAIIQNQLAEADRKRLAKAKAQLETSLRWFRVVNDRKLSPELMRRHIDFLKHETNTERIVVVIDSLHKLPFKDLTQRRSGIDGWLRHLEAIRDDTGVTFFVISELTRGQDGQFERQPQLGSFKGSGDIAYSADNALVLLPDWDPFDNISPENRVNNLWLVASREFTPGKVASYQLDYPYWAFIEEE